MFTTVVCNSVPGLTKEEVAQYFKVLKKGKKKSRHIRAMLVGHESKDRENIHMPKYIE